MDAKLLVPLVAEDACTNVIGRVSKTLASCFLRTVKRDWFTHIDIS